MHRDTTRRTNFLPYHSPHTSNNFTLTTGSVYGPLLELRCHCNDVLCELTLAHWFIHTVSNVPEYILDAATKSFWLRRPLSFLSKYLYIASVGFPVLVKPSANPSWCSNTFLILAIFLTLLLAERKKVDVSKIRVNTQTWRKFCSDKHYSHIIR